MRALRSGFAPLLLAASSALTACSSGDTILALTVDSDDTVGEVSSITVTVTADEGGTVTHTFTPPTAMDASTIDTSFFERIKVSPLKGEAAVVVVATSPAGNVEARTTAEIRDGGAVAAHVMLTRKPPPLPDGGSDAGAGDGGGDATGD